MKIIYAKISILFAFSIILISSCKKESDKGTLESNSWIESSNRTDTIVFKDGFLVLNLPKEARGGYLLPKLGAGPYAFKELKDSIGLQHALSSSSKFNNYAFKIENNTLYIGDFYQSSRKLLVFKKLR